VGAHVTQLGIHVAVHRQQQHEGAGALVQGHHQRRICGRLHRRSARQLAVWPDLRRLQLLTPTPNGAMATVVTSLTYFEAVAEACIDLARSLSGITILTP
jgi:hypothetical protein